MCVVARIHLTSLRLPSRRAAPGEHWFPLAQPLLTVTNWNRRSVRMETMTAVQHAEGPVARGIERQTAKMPSDVFLWAALASMGGSLALLTAGKRDVANFVGHWVPTILIMGLYNKLVKQLGSDRVSA
jgi:hypothetical protein